MIRLKSFQTSDDWVSTVSPDCSSSLDGAQGGSLRPGCLEVPVYGWFAPWVCVIKQGHSHREHGFWYCILSSSSRGEQKTASLFKLFMWRVGNAFPYLAAAVPWNFFSAGNTFFPLKHQNWTHIPIGAVLLVRVRAIRSWVILPYSRWVLIYRCRFSCLSASGRALAELCLLMLWSFTTPILYF